MNIFQNWISWKRGKSKREREREENPKLFCIIRAIKQFIQTAGDAINIAWWLAPLIFHLILYICFYDLPANRNTQRESRWVGNGWLRDKAGCRAREVEERRERGHHKTSFPHFPIYLSFDCATWFALFAILAFYLFSLSHFTRFS